MQARRKVAVILQFWQNFDRGILQGIAAHVRERRDWSVFVEEVEHQRIPDLKSWHGDGLIVNFDNPHVVRALRGVDKPIVAVGGGRGWHDSTSRIPYVATDDETIGRLAAEHLMDCGLRNFAFCGYPQNRTNFWMTQRKLGFSKRLEGAGFSNYSFHGRHTTATHWQDVLSELCNWLRKLPLPIGIMGCYDYRARHILEACKALGLRVPDDVAVIGVDNDVVCELADPPLSSVEQGRFRIGYSAAATLELLMSGKRRVPMQQMIAPVGIVARQSTNILCVADPLLATALRMIREHACHGLQAGEVAAQVGLSRNTLDKRCKEHIGRTIDLEIRRVRLECAKDLLARTALPLREIARKAGFGSEQYLSSVFSKVVGCRPSQHRTNHLESRIHPPP
jgi:LacI family transcriptional regulator